MTLLHTSWHSWQILFLLYTAKERSDLDLTGLSFQDWAFKFILLPGSAPGQAAAPALQSSEIYTSREFSFKKTPFLCLLLACGAIFQAAELHGVQQCPLLTSHEEPHDLAPHRDSDGMSGTHHLNFADGFRSQRGMRHSLPRASETMCFLLNIYLLTSAAIRRY